MSSVNTPPLRTAWEFDVSQAAKSSSLVIRKVERTERKFQELSRNATAQFAKVSRSVEESRGRISQMGRQIGLSEEAVEPPQRAAESHGRSAATVERSNRLAN